MLIQQKIFLREVIPTDVDVLLNWENDTENWEASNTKTPFLKEEIAYFVNSNEHIFTHHQMRFMICLASNHFPIGCVDLFDYDETLKKAGVGILIGEKKFRKNGFATQALHLLIEIAFIKFKLLSLFAEIDSNNKMSIKLFEKCNFKFIETTIKNKKTMLYYQINAKND